MLKTTTCKLILYFSFALLFSSCTYHPIIQQGNILDESSIKQIKLGMNKEQIAYLIGSPVLQDISNPNIWDYVYQERQNTKMLSRKTLRLEFDANRLIKMTSAKNPPQFIQKQE